MQTKQNTENIKSIYFTVKLKLTYAVRNVQHICDPHTPNTEPNIRLDPNAIPFVVESHCRGIVYGDYGMLRGRLDVCQF